MSFHLFMQLVSVCVYMHMELFAFHKCFIIQYVGHQVREIVVVHSV
jgi:hypothetical protein